MGADFEDDSGDMSLNRQSSRSGRIYDGVLRLAASLAFGSKPDGKKAVRLYEHLIRRTQDESAFLGLAKLLFEGNSQIQPDPIQAVRLYRQAITLHDSSTARFHLAEVFELGANGVDENPKEAAKLYAEAAERGDLDAMHNLAILLANGANGVPVDLPRAIYLLTDAIELGGDPESMTALAVLYERGGVGLEKDSGKAKELYEIAAKLGNADAANNLAVILEDLGDVRRASALYETAVRRGGHREALYNYGVLLEKGNFGVGQEPAKAAALFARGATDFDDSDSMIALARLLLRGGRGLARSPRQAVQLLQRANLMGSEVAKRELAFLLESGDDGLQAHPARAAALYADLAEVSGDDTCAVALARMLLCGAQNVPRNVKRAIELLELAVSRSGSSNALLLLGEVLEEGDEDAGIPPNLTKAVELFTMAVDKHACPYAMTRLGMLLEEGDVDAGIEMDRERARALYKRALKESKLIAASERLEMMEAIDGNKENVGVHINMNEDPDVAENQ